MRILAVAAAAALFAAPALAQSTGTTPSPAPNTGAATHPSGAKITVETQQKLRQSLEQSGFKNVQIVAESYLVRAQAPDGSHVIMTVSPDEVAEVVTGSSGPGQSGTSGGSGSGSSSSPTHPAPSTASGATSGGAGSK